MIRPIRTALLFLACLCLQAAAQAGTLREHPGHWLGELRLPNGQVLRIGVESFVRADGSPWASVASPDQGAYDIPVKAIRTGPGGRALLDGGFFEFELSWVKDHFEGTWKQGPSALPVVLHRVEAFPHTARPQDPRAPFPYTNQELAIRSRDGTVLGATLSMPTTRARPNAVVLVAGSGPQTRHAHNFGHRLFDVLADHLARQGIAVLRYDKRGVSRSGGDFDGATPAQLADDAWAAIRLLKADGRLGRIGFIGHSEGAQVAAAVAAAHPDAADFLVAMAGVGLPGLELMLLQDRQHALDNGATPEELPRLMAYVRKYYDTVLATPDGEARVAALKALFAALPAEDQALVGRRNMNVGTLAPEVAARAFLPASLKEDPRSYWSGVQKPVLVLGGSLDHQVPAEDNVAGIAAALTRGGNTRVEAAVLPSLNHGFQTARTGKAEEYERIGETMAPAAMRRITRFVHRQ